VKGLKCPWCGLSSPSRAPAPLRSGAALLCAVVRPPLRPLRRRAKPEERGREGGRERGGWRGAAPEPSMTAARKEEAGQAPKSEAVKLVRRPRQARPPRLLHRRPAALVKLVRRREGARPRARGRRARGRCARCLADAPRSRADPAGEGSAARGLLRRATLREPRHGLARAGGGSPAVASRAPAEGAAPRRPAWPDPAWPEHMAAWSRPTGEQDAAAAEE